jgi:hypothetical protein
VRRFGWAVTAVMADPPFIANRGLELIATAIDGESAVKRLMILSSNSIR